MKKGDPKRQERSRRRHGVNPPNAGEDYLSSANNPTSGSEGYTDGSATATTLGTGASRAEALARVTPTGNFDGKKEGAAAVARILGKADRSYVDPLADESIGSLFGEDAIREMMGTIGGGIDPNNPAKYEDATRGALPIDQYYPHYNPNPILGNVQGSMIGSQPIFGLGGALAPVGMIDARKKVLTDAAKQAYYRQKQQQKQEQGTMPEMPYVETHGAYQHGLNEGIEEQYKEIYAKHGGDPAKAKWDMEHLSRTAKSTGKLIDTVGERVAEIEEAKKKGDVFIPEQTDQMVADFYTKIDDFQKMPIDEKQKTFAKFGTSAAMPTLYGDFMKSYIHKDIMSYFPKAIKVDGAIDKTLLQKGSASYLTPEKQKWMVDMFTQNYKSQLSGWAGIYEGKSEAYIRKQVEKDMSMMLKAQLGMDWTQLSDGDGSGKKKGDNMRYFAEVRNQTEDAFANLGTYLEESGGKVDKDFLTKVKHSKYTLSDGSERQLYDGVREDNGLWLKLGINNSYSKSRDFTGEEVAERLNRPELTIPEGVTLNGKLHKVYHGFALENDPETPLTAKQIKDNTLAEIVPLTKEVWRFGKGAHNMSLLREIVPFAKEVKSKEEFDTKVDNSSYTAQEKAQAKKMEGIARLLAQFATDEVSYDDNGFNLDMVGELNNEGRLNDLNASLDTEYHKEFNRYEKPAPEVDETLFDID